MAQEQSAYSGTGTVEVLVNVVDPATGNHSTATIDTSTTRIDGFSTVPTVTQIGAGGIYKISFSSVTPAPTEGDRLVVKVNGTLTGAASAFTEYGIPVKVIAAETSSFDAATDQVTLTSASATAAQADVSALATSAALSGVETKIDTIDTNVDSILVDTGTDIPASIAALNNFDPATDTVTVGTNNDKTGYALSSAANDAIGAAFLAYTLTKGSPGTIERAFWQSLKATQLTDGEVSGTPTASAFDTNLTAVSGAYDHLLILFTSGTLAGEARPIDSYSSTNGRITLQEPLTAAPSSADEFIIVPDHSHPVSEVYEYFVSGSNEDAFKADVSALATQASVDTIDVNVDAIKVKTDQLTFTNPNSVDATATADVDEAAIADAVIAGIGGTDVTISSVIAEDGTTITIVRGDDYSASDSRAITWTGTTDDQWPSLSGATLKFTAKNNMDSLAVTPTVTQPTGTQSFRMELTSTNTEIMSGRYKYDVQATLSSGRVITLVVGEMIVKQTYTDRP